MNTKLFLLLLVLPFLFSCSAKSPEYKAILAKAEIERDAVVANLRLIKDSQWRESGYTTPYNALLKMLCRFQDATTCNYLIEKSAGDQSGLPILIYGLYRQGEPGRKFLSSFRDYDKNGKLNQNIANYLKNNRMTLADFIDSGVKTMREFDLSRETVNADETAYQFSVRKYPKYFTGERKLDDVRDVNELMAQNNFLSLEADLSVVFDNATFSSVLDGLSGNDKDKKFLAAMITSYWGLNIGVPVLLNQIESHPKEVNRCNCALAALKYVKSNNDISKLLSKLLDDKNYDTYREPIQEAILGAGTDESDATLMKEYNSGRMDTAGLANFAWQCGLTTEDFWQSIAKSIPNKSSNPNISKEQVAKDDEMRFNTTVALGRIRTLKAYQSISPVLAKIYKEYCFGYDEAIAESELDIFKNLDKGK